MKYFGPSPPCGVWIQVSASSFVELGVMGKKMWVSYLPIDVLRRSLDIARLAVDATDRVVSIPSHDEK